VPFVGEDHRLGQHVLDDLVLQRRSLPVGHNLRADTAAALDHPEHGALVRGGPTRASLPRVVVRVFGGLASARLTAPGGLVNLNLAAQGFVVVLGEQRADLLEHAVRGLVAGPDLALQLLRADATSR
jgi:hypothetical protein